MKLPKRTLRKKLLLQHFRCFYCGYGFTKDEGIEIDHIVPFSKSKDGTNKNLCLSCKPCNRLKSNLSLYDFKKVMEDKSPEKLIRGKFYFEFLNLINE